MEADCGTFFEILYSDNEDNDLKNIGRGRLTKWSHLNGSIFQNFHENVENA